MPRGVFVLSLLLLAGCVTRNPINIPPPDPYLQLRKHLAFIQAAQSKQTAHGQEVKLYIERTSKFIAKHESLMVKDSISGTAEDRPLAIAGLGFGGSWALDPLLKVLDDPDPAIRKFAIGALAYLRQRRVIRTDQMPAKRVQMALDSIFAPEVVAALFFFSTDVGFGEDSELRSAIEQKLRHANIDARVQATRALSIYKHPESVPVLSEAVGDQEPFVRSLAATALANILGDQAIPTLIPLLNDVDPLVVRDAIALIARLAPRGLHYRCASDGHTQNQSGKCPLCAKELTPAARR